MKKLARFFILQVLFVALFIISYCIIPSLVWMFGGGFLDVAQHPMYILFIGIPTIVVLGVLFNESFNSDFRSKS